MNTSHIEASGACSFTVMLVHRDTHTHTHTFKSRPTLAKPIRYSLMSLEWDNNRAMLQLGETLLKHCIIGKEQLSYSKLLTPV